MQALWGAQEFDGRPLHHTNPGLVGNQQKWRRVMQARFARVRDEVLLMKVLDIIAVVLLFLMATHIWTAVQTLGRMMQ
jgi:hypothetical protein